MPLGASRLNFLAKTAEVAAGPARTAVTVTANNGAAIDTADYEFGGSSIYFDRSSNHWVETGSIAGFGSTDDFTYECWFNYDTITSPQFLFGNRNGSVGNYITVYFDGANMFGYYHNQTAKISFTAPASGWHHFAVVRYNGDVKCYIDGTQQGSTYNSTADVINTESFAIGANDYTRNGAHGWEGHIDEIRFSDVARYTGSFTPSTSPFVNDSNTLLLVHADGTDTDTVLIDDNGDRAPNGIQAYNGAAISTTQAKFGNSSFVFDGTDDYISTPSDSNSNLYVNSTSSSPFTLEAWVYPTGLGGAIISDEITNQAGGFRVAYCLGMSTSGSIGFSGGGYYPWFGYYNGAWAGVSSNTALSTSTWSHVAAVFDGSGSKIYINGTDVTSGTQSSWATDVPNEILIGRRWDTDSNIYFNGYIDEVRISDTARYTSGFTAPTTAFENDANTVLLLHAEEGANGTTEIFDDNGGTLP